MRTHPSSPPIAAHHHIVVVGAGPAGLHAAHTLQNRGCANITVLEASERVGGKVVTEVHDGVHFEMGACFLHRNYTEVGRVVAELGLRPPMPRPGGSVWLDDDLGRIPKDVGAHSLLPMVRYTRLHKRLLPNPHGTPLPPRPTPAALRQLARPAAEVLYEAGVFPTLENSFRVALSAQGYGTIDEVPLMYALIWLNPAFLWAALLSGATRSLQARSAWLRHRLAVTHLLPDGFGAITDGLAARLRRPVELSARVVLVRRVEGGVSEVVWERGGQTHTARADWLVWAAPMKGAERVFDSMDDVERRFVAHMKTAAIATTAYIDDPVPEYTSEGWSIAYLLTKIQPGCDRRWYADRADGMIWAGEGRAQRQHRVAFQYAQTPGDAPENSPEAFLRELQRDFDAQGRDAEIVYRDGRPLQAHFDWFARQDRAAIEAGSPWDVLEHQGAHNTLWLGASMWFESVEHVFRYNRAVLDRIAPAL